MQLERLTGAEVSDRRVQLKELSPKHMDVMAMLAQGISRQDIARICDITPEYVTWLMGDPLCRAYLKQMSEAAHSHMEALFSKSVDVIADAMVQGSEDSRLKAAKLQLEATGRIGRTDRAVMPDQNPDRLEQLANRMLELLQSRRGRTIDGNSQQEIQSA